MAERLAYLAARLTARDVWLCQLLDEHRVLTTTQLADLAFPNLDTAQHRLAILHRLEVVERFRPRRDTGSAPFHYVLGPGGVRVLAARRGQDPSGVRYRRDDALAVAHWRHLDHLVAVNGFFCALARAARTRPDRALVAWWSERRCAARWGRLVRPDGYGRWRDIEAAADFFVEVDRATEPAWRLADKLDGYATLAAVTGVATPVLFWLPTPSARQPPAPRSPRPLPPRPCPSPPPAAGPATSPIPPVPSGSRLAAPDPASGWRSSPDSSASRRPRRRHRPPPNPTWNPMIPARRRPHRQACPRRPELPGDLATRSPPVRTVTRTSPRPAPRSSGPRFHQGQAERMTP